MTQAPPKFKSLSAPADLLPALKTYSDEVDIISAEAQRITEAYNEDCKRINSLIASNENKMAEAVYATGIIPKGTPFAVDTRYIEEHGVAFIRIADDSIQPNPLAGKMN